MNKDARTIRDIAKESGIELRRPSAEGPTVRVSDANLEKMLRALMVPVGEVAPTDTPKCHVPAGLGDHPAWGISLQLYELRSARNWGIGDFADLWKVCGLAADMGADFIGLNPLHAGFLSDPDRCSPYEPSSRRFLNPIYIAVDEIGGYLPDLEMAKKLSSLRDSILVDYAGVAEAKLQALRSIWQIQRNLPNFAFEAYLADEGSELHSHALFEALSQAMSALGHGAGWKSWPLEYQSREGPEVETFEVAHADEIMFHKWLQWCAHVQLAEAKVRARGAGMRIGLYLDLAVGEALDGSATWSEPEVYVSGAAVGNPPEPFAANGQDWRLAALLPASIAKGKNSPFARMLVASMKHAGAIRIDHAAAFARLFLVPIDGCPADGAYVSYPTARMLEVVSEVSQRSKCLVIGEDLGNVADGLTEDLGDANVLSYRILSYEQTEKGFKDPAEYPKMALACVSTHDHQTFRGWWRGADIDLRLEHGLVSPETTKQHRLHREIEREAMAEAFRRTGTMASEENPEDTTDLVLAAYEFVAKTPALLVAVRLADMTDEKKATNVPGTSGSYPNWKPKLSVMLEDLESLSLVRKIVNIMRRSGTAGARDEKIV